MVDPRVRLSTIPHVRRDCDARTARTSDSDHSVSPSNIERDGLVAPQPRFTAAFSLVSVTDSPTTIARGRVELTRPNSVLSAKGALKCARWFSS